MRSLLLFSFLLPLLVLGVDGAASILNADSEKAISDSFIVVLKKGVSEQKLAAHASWADGMLKDKTAKRRFTFSVGDFKGYHLQASKSVAALLAENEEVCSQQ